MGNYKYITNRILKNKAEEEKGFLKTRVPNDSDIAEGMYKCPECENQGKINQEWKRPFSVRCEKCNFLMRISKLKDEIKKEKAKEKLKKKNSQ
ncbi:MAG: hypothetical protein KKB03_03805 [Nanoarchaeota archaeon]|nr:hypothetical protein [Nanoarchaeota archaeon]MBU1135284.1 hypothetical protein [Nanoarchaeota archaeon]MBU2520339.1 hypothetical protein [Nanoarchaeota archaeon]